jgi:ketosteroid isomerase-like protein
MRILLVLLMLSAGAVHAGDDSAAALRSLLDAFLAGATVNDAAMHDRFWADDLVYTSSTGARFGKAEIMAGFEDNDEAEADGPAYAARDVNIRVFGDTAVLTFTLVATVNDGVSGRYYNSGVFRKRDGQWQAIIWHATVAAD